MTAPTWATMCCIPARWPRRSRAASWVCRRSRSRCALPGGGRHFRYRRARGAALVAALQQRPLDPGADTQRQRARSAGFRAGRLSQHAAGQPASLRCRGAGADPAASRCIGSAGRERRRRRRRHRFSGGREDGWVSVTPLQIDLTRHAALPRSALAGRVMSRRHERPALCRHRHDLGAHPRSPGAAPARAGHRQSRVLDRIRNVPRHIFVDEALASRAYEDTALPIGFGQTISQPYIVARMTEALLEGGPLAKVLEIGTGCGYQTAVLAPLVGRVYSVERIARCSSARASAQGAADPQHALPPRRWHAGLENAGTVRRHSDRGRAAVDSRDAGGATGDRRAADRAGRARGAQQLVRSHDASRASSGACSGRSPSCRCWAAPASAVSARTLVFTLNFRP
jgi:hypothetical protein